MKILVINCGSSSLKYQLVDMVGESVLCKGLVERIGIEGSQIKHETTGKEKEVIQEWRNNYDDTKQYPSVFCHEFYFHKQGNIPIQNLFFPYCPLTISTVYRHRANLAPPNTSHQGVRGRIYVWISVSYGRRKT